MSVYVDDMYRMEMGRFGRMKMSHMIADSKEELLEMARRIGVSLRWLQEEGTPREHFDISLGKRRLAVEAGAVEVTMMEMGRLICNREDAALTTPNSKEEP